MRMLNVLIYHQEEFEARGIQWVLEHQISQVAVEIVTDKQALLQQLEASPVNLLIMELEHQAENEKIEKILKDLGISWIGITMERTFEMASRALRWGASDLLLRPLNTSQLVRAVRSFIVSKRKAVFRENSTQQLRSVEEGEKDELEALNYSTLFLPSSYDLKELCFLALIVENKHDLKQLFERVQSFPFSFTFKPFLFNDIIFIVARKDGSTMWIEECNQFHSTWQQEQGSPLAIFINTNSVVEEQEATTINEAYLHTRQLTEIIFYLGFETVYERKSFGKWKVMDPFLTPYEQLEWIDMLQNQQAEKVKNWLSEEFLTLSSPYPNPTTVRVRLTSILAQIRRYMKARELHLTHWEKEYESLFEEIVETPVIYQIIQSMTNFCTRLLNTPSEKQGENPGTLKEKIERLIEVNYWNAQWGLDGAAKELNKHPAYISRAYSAAANRTFRQALNDYRINEAKKLLQESQLVIREIAKLTGFEYSSYFTNKFKNITGITPLAYRNVSKRG
ncbi:helix-turn-helix domain-containing protein [Jeotgalibacillus soli]|uniref:AraC family transcriptional regulator n=1 Tax=Jeotgalibacillus soli TaxID=889306 RepID=A0A0C2VKP2_9BACL|nr:helix-turn-helix domain-containing protein [Jeotgalibacillus soli]KIL49472.1 hypothetical protein KP78_09400 [Jeotgalibacillus soli]